MSGKNRLLSHFNKVKKVGQDRYVAQCVMPGHNDTNPSTVFTQKPDGTILIHCFGCGASGLDIIQALGLEPSVLFPPSDNPRYEKQTRHGFSAWQLLHALKDDLIFLVVAANQMLRDGQFDQADVDCLTNICKRVNEGLQYLEGVSNG